MHGRVLRVSDQTIYLEVSDQIRFETLYILRDHHRMVVPRDEIRFRFSPTAHNRQRIIVEDILSESHPRMR